MNMNMSFAVFFLRNIARQVISTRFNRSILLVKLRNRAKLEKVRTVQKWSEKRLQSHGLHIAKNAKIGDRLKLPHPIGIVIGDGVIIGNDVQIFQNVTIGGARIGDSAKKNHPRIGNGTIIFSGAAIIGGIGIGDNCIVGANSVVSQDIPSGSVVAGVPGRILRPSDPRDFKSA